MLLLYCNSSRLFGLLQIIRGSWEGSGRPLEETALEHARCCLLTDFVAYTDWPERVGSLSAHRRLLRPRSPLMRKIDTTGDFSTTQVGYGVATDVATTCW